MGIGVILEFPARAGIDPDADQLLPFTNLCNMESKLTPGQGFNTNALKYPLMYVTDAGITLHGEYDKDKLPVFLGTRGVAGQGCQGRTIVFESSSPLMRKMVPALPRLNQWYHKTD